MVTPIWYELTAPLQEMDVEERFDQLSRSSTPESLASTGTGNLDNAAEYFNEDEDEMDLDEGLEQTIAVRL